MPVNKKALSIARVMTRDHVREGQAKLAVDMQKAEEKAAKKAARLQERQQRRVVAGDVVVGNVVAWGREEREGGRDAATSTPEALN